MFGLLHVIQEIWSPISHWYGKLLLCLDWTSKFLTCLSWPEIPEQLVHCQAFGMVYRSAWFKWDLWVLTGNMKWQKDFLGPGYLRPWSGVARCLWWTCPHMGEHFLGRWFMDPAPSAVWTSLSYYLTATSRGASLPSVRKNTKAKCKTESQWQGHSLLLQAEVMCLGLVALSDIFHRDLWPFRTKWVLFHWLCGHGQWMPSCNTWD